MTAPDPRLVDLLRASERILVFTGAGISTGSGIPDYRGPAGVWATRQPVYFQQFVSSEAARVEYWDQKLELWPRMRDARPNATHLAVARLEAAGRVELVATQNIDGLHRKAGTSPERLVELHGTDLEVACLRCHARSAPEPVYAEFAASRRPPTCPACSGYLKPATVSFGQSLDGEDLERAFQAAGSADLVVALGSTLSVHPAASIPLAAARWGAAYVIVNRGPTDQDTSPHVTLRLEGDVAEIFPPAVEAAVAG